MKSITLRSTTLCCATLASTLSIAMTGLTAPSVQAHPFSNGSFTIAQAGVAESPELFRTLTGHEKPVNAVAIASNNRTVISGSTDQTLKVWNLDNGEMEKSLKNSFAANVITPSNDGMTILNSGLDRTIKLWRVTDGSMLRTYSNRRPNPEGGFFDDAVVRDLAFSPDGERFASAHLDKKVQIWDVTSGELLKVFTGHTDHVLSVAFSPDRRTLVSGGGGWDRTVRVWEISSGKQEFVLEGHGGWILDVAVSPNGEYIASASNDNTVKLWNARSGKLVRTLEGHKGGVRSIAFAPDNNTIYSGSMDRTIKEWDVETGRLMRTLTGHRLPVLSIGLSPNGRLLASGSEDKTVKIWKLERK